MDRGILAAERKGVPQEDPRDALKKRGFLTGMPNTQFDFANHFHENSCGRIEMSHVSGQFKVGDCDSQGRAVLGSENPGQPVDGWRILQWFGVSSV
jgi:hypothetical protein